MKLLLTGDWHLRSTAPESRIDDYFETVCRKLRWILEFGARNGVLAVLQAGDFFDNPNLPYYAFQEFVSIIRDGGIQIYTVYGQHDLRYRSKSNTPLKALQSTGLVYPFSTSDPGGICVSHKYEHVTLYGASWREDIPDPVADDYPCILITHQMVVDKKLWQDQKDFVYAKQLLNKHHKFNLILSGDNHKSFRYEDNNSILINPGSLMRSAINQTDHKPVVYLVEISGKSFGCAAFEVPIESADDVFSVTKIERLKELDERLVSFVTGVGKKCNFGLDFVRNLTAYIGDKKIPREVKIITNELIEEAGREHKG